MSDLDEGEHNKAIRRGLAVSVELRETESAFVALRKSIVDEMMETSPVNVDKILRLQAMGQAVTAVHNALLAIVRNGEDARTALAATGQTRTTRQTR